MSRKLLDNLAVSAFCDSMSMMMKSGIQTEEAVSLLLQENDGKGALTAALFTMREKLENGEKLSAAMKETGCFPEYAVNMIDASEESGSTDIVLERLSKYYADMNKISGKLRNLILYPSIMLVLIIGVLIVMLTLVLPVFTGVYESLTGSLSTSSLSYIQFGYIICYIMLGLSVLVAVLFMVGFFLFRSSKRSIVENFLLKFQLTRTILEDLAMIRFSSALSIFLASGEMQDSAVEKSVKMAELSSVEKKLEKVTAHMLEGHSVSDAAYKEGLFEPVYGRMLLAGERSGNLEEVLYKLIGLLEDNCFSKIDRLVSTLEPILSGVLMLTVGLSLLSVMLPLIGLMNSVR